MNNVVELISKGRTKEALDALPVTNESIHLKGRLSQLENNVMLGMLSFSEQSVERNKINQAVIALAKIESNSISIQKPTQMSSKESLLKVMSDYRRYRSLPNTKEGKYYSTAESLLKSIEEYESKKTVEPTYDVAGRMFRALNTQYLELMEALKEIQLDNKEDFAQAIKLKLGEDIPAWKDIESAYKLCVGRGMSNSRIEAAIKAKPTDMQSKIECADIIENWVANYLRG